MAKSPNRSRLLAIFRVCAGAFALASLLAAGIAAHPRQDQDQASDQLEQGPTWVNYIGAPPTPKGLKGRAVVFLFFGPETMRTRINWGLIQAQAVEFEGKVTFLGVFSGSSEAAQEIADQHNLFFPIGTDTVFRKHLGITQGSYQVFLDRDGGVYWHGPLSELWDAKIQKGSRGASNVFAEGALFVFAEREYDGRAGRIAKMMEKGQLKSALTNLLKLREDSKASARERAAGAELSQLLSEHIDLLAQQIEEQIGLNEALRAYSALVLVEKELRKTPFGAQFKARLQELKDDEAFQRELAADKAFANLYSTYWTRPPSKWKKKITYFLDKHQGTRAAQKARVLATH